MGFYASIKKNEIMSFAGKWMKLETIMLSEISQTEKVKGLMWTLERKREKKGGGDLMTIKRSVEERDQGMGGGKGGKKCWGVMLLKLYCFIVYMYKYHNEKSHLCV